MTLTEYNRYQKRLAYGYTPEQAFSLPKRMPRWMAAIEDEEGLPIVDVINRELKAGMNYSQIARSFDMNIATLYHWIQKWEKQGLINGELKNDNNSNRLDGQSGTGGH
jgi:DNA invertase Pin-like site-specific DNA recombinase